MVNSQHYLHLIRQDCPLPKGAHVVLYCRDSGGEEQDKSVEQQKEVALEYCKHFGLVLDAIYEDEARRATAVEKRDGFAAMMDDLHARFSMIYDPVRRAKRAQAKPFGIICWKSNRLGRDVVHTRHVKSDLRLRGITIISLMPTIETGNAGLDSALESFFEYQDELLLQGISDDAKRGLAQLVSMRDTHPEFRAYNPDWPSTGAYLGIMPGGVPKGFRAERIVVGTYKRKNGKRNGELREVQRIVPDEALWERCRLAWTMRSKGASLTDIKAATELFSSVSSYASFFKNLIYTGTLEYGGQRLENFVPALITMEMWEAEQAKRNERGKRLRGESIASELEPRRVGGQHLLSGLLYCGQVDGEEHPMHAGSIPAKKGVRGEWRYYICNTKKNSRGMSCDSDRVGARMIEKAVIESVLTHVLNREYLRPLADAIHEENADATRDARAILDSAEEKLAQVERQIANLVDAIAEGGLSSSLKERLNTREAERIELRATIANQKRVLEQVDAIANVTDEMLDGWLTTVRNALTGGNVDIARSALRQFVEKIVLKGDQGDIVYAFDNVGGVERLVYGSVDLRGSAPLPSQNGSFRLIRREDPNPDKVALAAQIMVLKQSGWSYRSIGRHLGIHWTRVQQIVKSLR